MSEGVLANGCGSPARVLACVTGRQGLAGVVRARSAFGAFANERAFKRARPG